MLYYQIITSITTDRNIRLEVLRMHRNCYETRTNDKKTYYCVLCCTDHNLIVQSTTVASPTVPCALQQFVCLSNCLFHIFLRISAQAQISISLGIHSNGRTTNCRNTYCRTTYNRPVSAMVCTINNMQCEHLTIHGDGITIYILWGFHIQV